MFASNPTPVDTVAKKFTFSTNQAAGTYDICSATGGDVYVLNYSIKTGTAVGGLTSASIQTNNTTPLSLLASTLLASLTGDKILAQSGSGFLLESGKKIQGTIIGVGNAGTVIVAITYVPIDAGASLA